MRVLFLTQYFLPQPLANAEVIGGLASALAKQGNEVHAVTAARAGAAPGVVTHCARSYFAADRSSLAKRFIEYATFSVTGLLATLRAARPDVIVVPSPPPTLGIVGVIAGRLRRVPVVYNVQDLYPEVAAATGTVGSNVVLRALGVIIRWMYRRCAAVVVIDPQFVARLHNVTGGVPVHAIRNAIDLSPFKDVRPLRAELGLAEDDVVVMYAGNVGRSQDLRAIARATGAAGARLVIHGDGAGLDDLRRFVGDERLGHVTFSAFRPREQLGRVFATADVHVVPLKPGIATASVPSKLLSIFAAGRCAVVTAEHDSATAAVVREAGGGWVVEPGDEAALVAAIREAAANVDERRSRGVAARAWAARFAGTDRAAAEYMAVLKSVAP